MDGHQGTAKFNPDWEVWLERDVPRDPNPALRHHQEWRWKATAFHNALIQAKNRDRNRCEQRLRRHHLQKGQSFLRMLESFLGEEVFRDGMRKYQATHKFSNTTTIDLGTPSAKPPQNVAEIAANWTEQPVFRS